MNTTEVSRADLPAHTGPHTVPARHRVRWLRTFLAPLAVAAVVILLWQGIVRLFAIPEYVIPAPSAVWHALVSNPSLYLRNLKPTAIEAVLGFLLGNTLATLVAISFVHSRTLERSFFPLAVVLQAVPIVGIAPVIVIVLGLGYLPKIVIAALISFFPTLVNMVRGLQAVDARLIELMRVLSAGRLKILFKVRMFAALPYLFAALKITATSSVIGAIVAEWIGSQAGLGYLIIQATYNYNTPSLYAAMFVSSLLAVAFFALVGGVERMVIRWEVQKAK